MDQAAHLGLIAAGTAPPKAATPTSFPAAATGPAAAAAAPPATPVVAMVGPAQAAVAVAPTPVPAVAGLALIDSDAAIPGASPDPTKATLPKAVVAPTPTPASPTPTAPLAAVVNDAAATPDPNAAASAAAVTPAGPTKTDAAAPAARSERSVATAAAAANTANGATPAAAPTAATPTPASPGDDKPATEPAGTKPGETGLLAPVDAQTVTTSEAARPSPATAAISGEAPAARTAPQPLDATGARTASTPNPVTHQVAVHLERATGEGRDRFTIQLSPPDLGRIDVRLEIGGDGRISAVFGVDRQQTLDLLQRDARDLQRALQDSGLRADSGSLSFNLRGEGRGGQSLPLDLYRDRGYGAPADNNALADGAATPTRPAAASTRRLDIQV